MRSALPFIALASVLAGSAWRAHAGAAAAGAEAALFPPVPAPTSSRKIDEYGDIRWSDEKARLNNLAVEARNDPTAVAYLVCYGGRRARKGEAFRRCSRAAGHLWRAGVEAARIVMLDGGHREELTVELWLLPATARPPTLTPTVDPSEVTTIKDATRRKRRPRMKR